jgi:membrane-associated phospholipid phosphatase
LVFIFEGITRITDFYHHPTDVLAGAILGTIIAIIAVRKFEFPRKLILI